MNALADQLTAGGNISTFLKRFLDLGGNIMKGENIIMPDIYNRLIKSLVPGGVLYMSYKHGSFKGIQNGRYFCDYTWTELKHKLEAFPKLEVIDSWKSYDVRKGRSGERWLNVLCKKAEE